MSRALIGLLLLAGCSSSARPRSDDGEPRPAASVPPAQPEVADARLATIADAPTDAPEIAIVDAPLAWSDERARLTLDYRRAHSDARATDLEIEPRVIVLHHTGGSSVTGTRTYFDTTRIEASRAALARGGAVNVSAHFVVDRDGTIYKLLPETRFARHCIGLNHLAIGIENVGGPARWPLTEAQVLANAALVRDLVRRFPITHLLGHHEVMAFREHPYYVELDRAYRNSKPDPGAAFMERVRAEVIDLELAGL